MKDGECHHALWRHGRAFPADGADAVPVQPLRIRPRRAGGDRLPAALPRAGRRAGGAGARHPATRSSTGLAASATRSKLVDKPHGGGQAILIDRKAGNAGRRQRPAQGRPRAGLLMRALRVDITTLDVDAIVNAANTPARRRRRRRRDPSRGGAASCWPPASRSAAARRGGADHAGLPAEGPPRDPRRRPGLAGRRRRASRRCWPAATATPWRCCARSAAARSPFPRFHRRLRRLRRRWRRRSPSPRCGRRSPNTARRRSLSPASICPCSPCTKRNSPRDRALRPHRRRGAPPDRRASARRRSSCWTSCIARIEAVDHAVNAMVARDFDRARARGARRPRRR